ncbi:MAG: ATP-binding cassette domain-containing protein, partial [Phycisphaeraceae bacterium]|nr:ATP-binding cassette domain-containing protein [Phycisphaeraceae bacterium]
LQAVRSKFGVLFQSAALLQWMNVRDNVALPLREHTKLPDDEILSRVNEKLDLLSLGDAGDKFPSDISGGMQKRAGLARAIIMNPKIVLYDEPTSGLDPVTSRRIDDLIMDMRKRLGITSVVVTHDLDSAFQVADRMVLLHEGRVRMDGTPDEMRHTTDPVARAFLEGREMVEGPSDDSDAVVQGSPEPETLPS